MEGEEPLAGSRPGSAGLDPWVASPRTGGPLGSNKDAADPETPAWFLGNTPGPLGHNDFADPNKQSLVQITRFNRQSLIIASTDTDCKVVQRELDGTHRIRDAFADPELLKKAQEQNLTGGQYATMVNEKVFPPKPRKKTSGSKEAPSEPEQTYVSPMHTDPYTCHIFEDWPLSEYQRRGLPEIIYQADKAHEESHQNTCAAARNYDALMKKPENRSADEVKAYDVKIHMLEDWIKNHCPHHKRRGGS
jgi:hypothetical protein